MFTPASNSFPLRSTCVLEIAFRRTCDRTVLCQRHHPNSANHSTPCCREIPRDLAEPTSTVAGTQPPSSPITSSSTADPSYSAGPLERKSDVGLVHVVRPVARTTRRRVFTARNVFCWYCRWHSTYTDRFAGSGSGGERHSAAARHATCAIAFCLETSHCELDLRKHE